MSADSSNSSSTMNPATPTPMQSPKTYQRCQFRGWKEIKFHMRLEWQLFKKEWLILIPCIIMQYVHGVFHNYAYWIQAHELTIEQRTPLYDLGYQLLGQFSGPALHVSEYLVFGAVFAPAILLVLSVPVFKPNPNKPRFIVIILKRALIQISICLVLRIISFMVTALPGPTEHCRLEYNDACLASGPNNTLDCVIPNPDFQPPTVAEFFYKMDALEGCGDLMFSSHTIYTVSLICCILKYWYRHWLLVFYVVVQSVIAIFIIGSHKHYTLDVYSALYIVPMVWFLQEAYHKDINCKDEVISAESIERFYGLHIHPEYELQSSCFDSDPIQVAVVVDVPPPAAANNATKQSTPQEPTATNYQRSDSM